MSNKNKILVVVDCQNDFITGSLANEEAQKKIPNIVRKINEFDGDNIFVTLDTHFPYLYLNSKEGEKLPVESHKAALLVMKHCQIEVVNEDE